MNRPKNYGLMARIIETLSSGTAEMPGTAMILCNHSVAKLFLKPEDSYIAGSAETIRK